MDWLSQKLNRACFHGSHRGWNIAMTREENDRNLHADLGHPLLKIEPAQAWHLEIQQDTIRRLSPRPGQEFLRGGEGRCLPARRPDQPPKPPLNRGIIIHNRDDRFRYFWLAHVLLFAVLWNGKLEHCAWS